MRNPLRKTVADDVFGMAFAAVKKGDPTPIGPASDPFSYIEAAEDIQSGKFITVGEDGRARVAHGPRRVWVWQR